MNNNLVNEISQFRAERMGRLTGAQVTRLVTEAVKFFSESAYQALLGIDAEEDGVTYDMWRQAVSTAEMQGALVFPQYMDESGIPADAEPVQYGEAQLVVAGRVARAILVLNGMGDAIPADAAKEDWYLL